MTATIARDAKTLTDHLVVPIGTDENGGTINLDLTSNPNTFIAGTIGSGKTVFVRNLISGLNAAGVKVVAIDTTCSSGTFFDLVDRTAIYTDRSTAIEALEGVVAEIAKRRELIHNHGVSNWQQLPEGFRNAEGIGHLAVVIDEYATTVMTSRPLHDTESEIRDSEEHNAAAERISHLLLRIAHEARSCGIYLVISSMIHIGIWAPLRELGSDLGNRILVLRPGSQVTATMVDVAFDRADRVAVEGVALALSPVTAHGNAILTSRGEEARSFQFTRAG